MATTKTVNVTTGKFLNYQVTKTGYKPVTGTVFVDSNKTRNLSLLLSKDIWVTNAYTMAYEDDSLGNLDFTHKMI